jgi:hypothetical protein
MKDEVIQRITARAFLGGGLLMLFITFITADSIFVLTFGSFFGILFLYLAVLAERIANFEKYEAGRLEWKPLEGVDYYKGLEEVETEPKNKWKRT